jgi:hypothetical protein
MGQFGIFSKKFADTLDDGDKLPQPIIRVVQHSNTSIFGELLKDELGVDSVKFILI